MLLQQDFLALVTELFNGQSDVFLIVWSLKHENKLETVTLEESSRRSIARRTEQSCMAQFD